MQIYDLVSRRMFSQISRIPDLIRKFCAKNCDLYVGVYGNIWVDYLQYIYLPCISCIPRIRLCLRYKTILQQLALLQILTYTGMLLLFCNYIPRSASGQGETNFALRLATQAGKMVLFCLLRTTRRVLHEKFPRKPYNKSLIVILSVTSIVHVNTASNVSN